MATETVDLGKVLITHKGDWTTGTDYEALDVVGYNGSSYLCILAASSGILVTNTTYWRPLSLSAYSYAISAGYTGTSADFANDLSAIGDKLDTSQIKQTTGTSETDVMSQKAVSDELITKAAHGYTGTAKTLKEVDDAKLDKIQVISNRTNQLFNKDSYREDTSMVSTGEFVEGASAGYGTTDNIPLAAGETHITISGWSAQVHRIAFFDDSNAVVGDVIFQSSSSPKTAAIPTGATYMVAMFATSNHATIAATLMINYGEAALAYEAFYGNLKSVMGYEVGDVAGALDRVAACEAITTPADYMLTDFPEIITTSDLTYFNNKFIVDIYKQTGGVYNSTLYLRLIKNKAGANGGILQFYDAATGGNLVAQWVNSTATEPRQGVKNYVVSQFSSSGITFNIAVNWDIIGETATNLETSLGIDLAKVKELPRKSLFTRLETLEGIDKYDTELYLNVFGEALPQSFKGKMFEANKDIEIVLVGDSLTGNIDGSGAISSAAQTPPSLSHYHWSYLLWERICKNKPVCDRLDSQRNSSDVFTKTGAWAQISADDFDAIDSFGEFSLAALTYRSADLNAQIAFTFQGGSYDKFNIVHTLSDNGADCVVNIAGGNGILLCSTDKTNWVEANGFEISQNSNPLGLTQEQSETAGLAWHQRHRRIWFKKAATLTTDLVITFKRNPADTDVSHYMYCWGTEKWKDNTVFVTNIGRGGRNVRKLGINISDVFDRNPDLTVFEMPLANEIISLQMELVKGYYESYFLTDAVRSFKTLSNNFVDTEVMVVLPHGFDDYWVGDQATLHYIAEFANEGISYTKSKTMFQYLKTILNTYSEHIGFVNLQDQLINEAKYRGLTIQQSLAPGSFTVDGIHLNALGSKLWAKYIAPIFQ